MEFETPFRPLLSELGLDLYDVELVAGYAQRDRHRPGGVDLEALTGRSHALSAWLDEHDPIPGHFTLDVSSPGLERKLRTPAHFARASGELVTLRERREGESTRRLEGVVVGSDEASVTLEDKEPARVVVASTRRAGPHGLHVGRRSQAVALAAGCRHEQERLDHGEL